MPDFLIRLPWPPRELSPNCRKDRRRTTRQRAAYRDAGFYASKEVGAKVDPDAHLCITFHPPDDRRRDLDNMLASAKFALDGIASASGVDDYGWSFSIKRAEKVKGGAVLVHVKTEQSFN